MSLATITIEPKTTRSCDQHDQQFIETEGARIYTHFSHRPSFRQDQQTSLTRSLNVYKAKFEEHPLCRAETTKTIASLKLSQSFIQDHEQLCEQECTHHGTDSFDKLQLIFEQNLAQSETRQFYLGQEIEAFEACATNDDGLSKFVSDYKQVTELSHKAKQFEKCSLDGEREIDKRMATNVRATEYKRIANSIHAFVFMDQPQYLNNRFGRPKHTNYKFILDVPQTKMFHLEGDSQDSSTKVKQVSAHDPTASRLKKGRRRHSLFCPKVKRKQEEEQDSTLDAYDACIQAFNAFHYSLLDVFESDELGSLNKTLALKKRKLSIVEDVEQFQASSSRASLTSETGGKIDSGFSSLLETSMECGTSSPCSNGTDDNEIPLTSPLVKRRLRSSSRTNSLEESSAKNSESQTTERCTGFTSLEDVYKHHIEQLETSIASDFELLKRFALLQQTWEFKFTGNDWMDCWPFICQASDCEMSTMKLPDQTETLNHNGRAVKQESSFDKSESKKKKDESKVECKAPQRSIRQLLTEFPPLPTKRESDESAICATARASASEDVASQSRPSSSPSLTTITPAKSVELILRDLIAKLEFKSEKPSSQSLSSEELQSNNPNQDGEDEDRVMQLLQLFQKATNEASCSNCATLEHVHSLGNMEVGLQDKLRKLNKLNYELVEDHARYLLNPSVVRETQRKALDEKIEMRNTLSKKCFHIFNRCIRETSFSYFRYHLAQQHATEPHIVQPIKFTSNHDQAKM